jgi:hypothetical protein
MRGIFAAGTVVMLSNLTYKSVEEASQLGAKNLRVYARLITHRIDAVLCNARSAASAGDLGSPPGPATSERSTTLDSGYRAWFAGR